MSRSVARREASSTPAGSTSRAKRWEESVETPMRRATRRISPGRNHAASKRTSVVDSVTPESTPPITPATTSGRWASAMTQTPVSSFTFLPSRRTISSPSRAGRASMPSETFFASNAWSGWPSSSSTQFVISTTLLIGRRPAASRSRRSHSGLGPTFTFFNVRSV